MMEEVDNTTETSNLNQEEYIKRCVEEKRAGTWNIKQALQLQEKERTEYIKFDKRVKTALTIYAGAIIILLTLIYLKL